MLSNEGSELLRIPEKSALLCFSLDRPLARSIVFRHTPIPDIALGCLECSVQLRLRPKKILGYLRNLRNRATAVVCTEA
jgi:hypothetical protein